MFTRNSFYAVGSFYRLFLYDSYLFIFYSSILIVLKIELALNDDQIPLELF